MIFRTFVLGKFETNGVPSGMAPNQLKAEAVTSSIKLFCQSKSVIP
jgi:hypothetical protein